MAWHPEIIPIPGRHVIRLGTNVKGTQRTLHPFHSLSSPHHVSTDRSCSLSQRSQMGGAGLDHNYGDRTLFVITFILMFLSYRFLKQTRQGKSRVGHMERRGRYWDTNNLTESEMHPLMSEREVCCRYREQ